jgi:molybdate transport system substrate-binding protein
MLGARFDRLPRPTSVAVDGAGVGRRAAMVTLAGLSSGLGSAVAWAQAEPLRLAAASDLRFALDEVVERFRAGRPDARVELIYGSSGKITTQILNGAPFDVFLSADVAFTEALQAAGHAATAPRLYGIGRLASWSLDPALGRLPLDDLVRSPRVRRLAIANPEHAPYGRRAIEALTTRGLLDDARPKLVQAENIAQAAQFVESGAAQAGLVAHSLLLSPALAGKGAWVLVPDTWHQPLRQAFVVSRRAASDPLARAFAEYLEGPDARTVLRRYGFTLPGEADRADAGAAARRP